MAGSSVQNKPRGLPARAPEAKPNVAGGVGRSPLESMVLDLQRDVGNRAVTHVLQRLAPTPGDVNAEQRHRTLRRGDSGEDVKTLQIKLGRQDFRDSADHLDGKFGPKTYADVVQFQRTHGLKPDGEVGRRTWNALDTYTPQEVHEKDEADADALFASANAAQSRGELDLAIAMYTSILRLPASSSPEASTGASYNRGVAHHKLGRFELASADYLAVLNGTHNAPSRRAGALQLLQKAKQGVGPNDELPKQPAGDVPVVGDPSRPDLAEGATGPAVDTLQAKLFAFQFANGGRPKSANGVFGSRESFRIATLRSEVGLPAGKTVDRDVWHALDTYIPADKTTADTDAIIAADQGLPTELAPRLAGAIALEALVWSPEMLALLRERQAVCHHAMGNFPEAIAAYRQAIELPRLEKAAFPPESRARILEHILMARRRQRLDVS